MLMQINQWWLAREARERSLLTALAGFLVVVLFYLLLWSPMQQAKQNAELKLQNAQQTWEWLNQQVPLVERTGSQNQNNKPAVENQSQLLRLVQNSLRQQNLFKDIKSVKGVSKGAEVRFDEVSASRLFRWLAELEQKGVSSSDLKVSYIAADKVKAKIEFKLN